MSNHTVQNHQAVPLLGAAEAFPVPRGLTQEAAAQSRAAHGRNVFGTNRSSGLLATLLEAVTEPMFLLLLAACTVYLVLGQTQEAVTLGVALLLVSGISVYQSLRSDRALGALRDLTQPKASVWRGGRLVSLATEEIVVGDAVELEEGERLPADGTVYDPNDFTVDESVLTGESVAVSKAQGETVFAGTHAATGRAWMSVTAVGSQTELGRIGLSLESLPAVKTPLQVQINTFVLRMAWIGAGAFVVVWGVNYARSGNWVTALLFGLTLAMSVLPEEIPVAFSSFMALGAARLSRMGILTKQPQTVESLGSATIICADKTGTLTQNGMALRRVYDGQTGTTLPFPGPLTETARKVLACARWASETEPFDAMEQALVAALTAADPVRAAQTTPMIHEYPLAGTPPMMTHVREVEGQQTVAGKGAIEHVLAVCHLAPEAASRIRAAALELAAQGYRVLGVAQAAVPESGFPEQQDEFAWTFLGLVALENPPKPGVDEVVRALREAGIQVKMITGDSPETAQAIARQVGLPGADQVVTGQQVMSLDQAALIPLALQTAVFARMFPEAKLRVVQALRVAGEVVAMTGDGVNDGPALKAAHIGVAMGKRGTEVARQAASLVLVDDDLARMVDAAAQGRRIYQNLQKAVAYIVSIHIPIILTVTAPLLLGWRLDNLLSPIHVIVLELVMGPTCSVAFENEPAEPGQMQRPPRRPTDSFLAGKSLSRSIWQGLGITAAVLSIYAAVMTQGEAAPVVRTLVFTTLVLSNILLVLVNRSFTLSAWRMVRVPNRVLWLLLGLTLTMLLTTLFFPPARQLFGFAPVSWRWLGWCALAAVVGVGWVEGVKALANSQPQRVPAGPADGKV